MKQFLIQLSLTVFGCLLCSASGTAMFRIFDQAHRQNPSKNLLLSPFGIEQCFGMASCGAGEKSGKELAEILGINPAAAAKNKPALLKTHRTPAEFNSFNAVLYNRKYTLFPEFVQLCSSIYGGRIFKLDFSQPKKCADFLNALIKRESRNQFDKIFSADDLGDDDAAILMNVLYFKAGWEEPFHKHNTRKELFYPHGKSAYNVDMMMHSTRYIPYYDDGKIQAVSLAYTDPNYRMWAVMAKDKSEPLSSVTGFLAKNGLDIIRKNAYSGNETKLSLPKLKLRGDLDLAKLFQTMGMRIIFDPQRGDLNKIIKEQPLYISQAKQLVNLNLDETGTEVAALTYIRTKVGAAPGAEIKENVFCADHPFVLILENRTTGDILLTAAVMTP